MIFKDRFNLYGLFIAIVFFNVVITSCVHKEGDWDDNIHLSTKEVFFSSSSDSVVITTEGSGWWIGSITYNGLVERLDEVDTTDDMYIFNRPDYIIERRDETTLYVQMDENLTGQSKVIHIGFQAGNYYDFVTITQE